MLLCCIQQCYVGQRYIGSIVLWKASVDTLFWGHIHGLCSGWWHVSMNWVTLEDLTLYILNLFFRKQEIYVCILYHFSILKHHRIYPQGTWHKKYPYFIESVSWLLVKWHYEEPGHQQPGYWPSTPSIFQPPHQRSQLMKGLMPGPWFNIKMSSYQYRKSHYKDKTVVRSYLHNGISYTGKMASLYWVSPLVGNNKL